MSLSKLWKEIRNDLLEVIIDLNTSKKNKSSYRRIQKSATQEFKNKIINSFEKNPLHYKKYFAV